ncbi:Sjogren's syndrome/scleroderma autoantigen 1 (Autoantigen p27) [Haladaptatus litoreus]|uniref:Sjogren's syndrome/scleroderma autoantigen 1 (Autoantigen p27) n=1 Tax=Haladaptatus litoreus TaxID=553468 RepID=A0A1N7BRN3_9EURY|nr:Sjogren's syndrome/scleroderma autoantigen 1 family protein [Haladaptatus litoreus]SIR53960.1 Sjogren's syndrome/scleroderma autoantigen 1 (Autoantigen p27) [Haladaptatus litoreus]
MSDFDKEAEREKLRQQYEAEKEERKATQRMSELLLQGATMTGKHCDTCGDPIFRQNGTEFCPTCQQQQPAGETPAESESAQNADNQERQTEETASAEVPSADATNIEVEQSNAETTGQSAPSGQSTAPSNQPRRASPSQADTSNGRSPEPRTAVEQNERGAGDLAEARNALVRKLTRLAMEAEQTDDVGRARELLAATREGAEALDALDRAKR